MRWLLSLALVACLFTIGCEATEPDPHSKEQPTEQPTEQP